MRLIGIITNEGFTSHIWEDADGRVQFIADADIDCDGGPNPHHDPCWQPDTTLHFPARPGGSPINSELVPGIVVPPMIVKGVRGIVLGCLAKVTRMHRVAGQWQDAQSCEAVVFDTGPAKKVGEISPACAKLIGVDPNPNTGGEDNPIIRYELWPGTAAKVAGIRFQLQPSRG